MGERIMDAFGHNIDMETDNDGFRAACSCGEWAVVREKEADIRQSAGAHIRNVMRGSVFFIY